MIKQKFFPAIILILLFGSFSLSSYSEIPLPEHPRPDYWRIHWQNLNGAWNFQFDEQNQGESEKWFETKNQFSDKILVPFS